MALSVGDILTALVYIPTHIINVNVSLDVPCNGLGIEQFFTIFLGTSATILTTIICMDRYIFISRPCQRMLSSPSSPSNQRRHSTRKIFIVYCIVTYSISFSFSITAYQNITLNNSYRSSLKYSILSFVIYTVMLLASLVFNTLLIRYVYNRAKEIKTLGIGQTSYQYKATKTVLMISGVQILTIMPWIICLAAVAAYKFSQTRYQRKTNKIIYMYIWLKMPLFLNSFMNAVVFIRRDQRLVKFYRDFFSRIIKRSVRNENSISTQARHIEMKDKRSTSANV